MKISIKEIVEQYQQDPSKYKSYNVFLDTWDEVGKEFLKLIGADSTYDLEFRDDSQSNLFTEVYYSTWVCTDTPVGLKLIVETANPTNVLAVTWQSARKNDVWFYWASESAIQRVYWLLSRYVKYESPVDKAKKTVVDSFEL